MLKRKRRKDLNTGKNSFSAQFIKVLLIIICVTIMGCNKTEKSVKESDKCTITEKPVKKSDKYPIFAAIPKQQIDFVINSQERYCIYDGEHYGFIKESGEELTPYIYDIAYPFHEGLACVSYKKKFGFIDLNGNETIPFIYDDASPFMEGLAYFAIGDRYGFIDKKGKPVFYLECDSVSSFQDGLAYFSINGKYGYINKLGNTIIQPIYDNADYFQNGLAIVIKNGKQGVINKEGKEVLAPLYNYIDIYHTIIIAKTNNQYYCFDNKGKKYLTDSYDKISLDEEGRFYIQKKGKYGFANSDGTIAVPPKYEEVSLIPGKELAIAKNNNLFGVIDFQGNIKVPFIYQNINFFSDNRQKDGILVVTLNNRKGCLNLEDFSECIPIKYNSITDYANGKLVVKKREKYGVIYQNGKLDTPIEFDKVQLFEDGSVALELNQITFLFNSNNELIHIGSDEITKEGKYYQIKEDKKYSFVNENGEEILSLDESYYFESYYCYNMLNIHVFRFDDYYGILKSDNTTKTDITHILLKNMITPRIHLFYKFTQNPPVNKESKSSWGEDTIRNKGYVKQYKLFDLDGSGKPILYYSSLPYILRSFSLCDSGFCAIRNNQLHYLITGYESGGSMGGENAHLFYDKKTGQIMIGVIKHYGGFCGFEDGVTIYSCEKENTLEVISYSCTHQSSKNYEKNILINNASLLYNENGKSYTRDNVLQAESVTEYTINQKRVSKEKYTKLVNRYSVIDMLFPMI